MYKGKIVKELMDERGVHPSTICRDLNVYRTTLRCYIEGSNPTAKTLETLADYFNVPIDYFFERKSVVDTAGEEEEEERKENLIDLRIKSYEDNIKYLRLLLQEKDKHIETLKSIAGLK